MKYAFNKKSGKVHIFKDYHKERVNNPSYPPPIDHHTHVILNECNNNFKWVSAPYKVRDFGEDYEITATFPEGRQLCGSCKHRMGLK